MLKTALVSKSLYKGDTIMKRCRFYTRSKDYRPVELLPDGYKWWLTGFAGVSCDTWILTCYLPEDIDPKEFWPEAYGIEVEAIGLTEMSFCDGWETKEGIRNSPTNCQKFIEVFGFKPTSRMLTTEWWNSAYKGDN